MLVSPATWYMGRIQVGLEPNRMLGQKILITQSIISLRKYIAGGAWEQVQGSPLSAVPGYPQAPCFWPLGGGSAARVSKHAGILIQYVSDLPMSAFSGASTLTGRKELKPRRILPFSLNLIHVMSPGRAPQPAYTYTMAGKS